MTPAVAATIPGAIPGAAPGATPAAAPDGSLLHGTRTTLRVVDPADYPFLRQLASSDTTLLRWRDRGQTPRPEQFVENLWAGVVAQFVVERRATGQPLGLVSCYAADARNRIAHLAVLFDPDADTGRRWRIEGVLLFVNYLFEAFDLRKLYAEVPAFNLDEIRSGIGRLFEEEGRLIDHEYLGGRYWDMHLLALHRERFLVQRHRLLPGLVPAS